MRPARVNSWRDARMGALVLTKMVVSYVMGTDFPATDVGDLENMRDGFISALPWAFDIYVDDDDEWPEPEQHTPGECDAGAVARRLAWFEGVLRVTFAARRDRERLVVSAPFCRHATAGLHVAESPAPRVLQLRDAVALEFSHELPFR